MQYEQIQPPESLRDYVRYYWTLNSPAPGAGPETLRTIADGCPGIVFQPASLGVYHRDDKGVLPEVFLFGQATKHAELRLSGTFTTIGVYFYPDALKSVFGLDAFELTNSCLDLNELAADRGVNLSERLLNAPAARDRIEILSAFLLDQIERNSASGDWAVQFCLSEILKSEGNVSLMDLRTNLRISERSLERKFKRFVGISPKLFSRICRFQSSLTHLKTRARNRMTDIAFDNDYADQSHFIRVFKEFSGITPFQYQKQCRELVENLVEIGSA